MVKKNEVRPCPPVPPCPPPPQPIPQPIPPVIPIVSVSSVDGMTGDVILRDLVIGDKTYNGSDEIIIELEDLGLERAVRYKGRFKKSRIDELEPEVGDLYFCIDDKLFYLSDGQGYDWITFKSYISDEDIRSISVDKLKLPIDSNHNVDIPLAKDGNAGLVRLSAPFHQVSTGGVLTINFDEVPNESISVAKLYGEFILQADETIKPQD